MALRRGYIVLLPFLILVLSGCFRQASQPYDDTFSQPVSNTAAPLDAATPTLSIGIETEEPTPTEDTTQPTPAIAITVETSIPAVLPTDIPQSTPTEDTGGGVNIIPVTSPTAQQIVTPISPIGPSAISTPTPVMIDITPTPSGLVTPTQASNEMVGDCVYIVQPGDNLYRISINNGTTLDELRAANPNIIGDLIQPGDRINIPGCEPAGTSETTPPPDGTGGAGGITDTGTQTIHVVQPGETLSVIARQYGVTITAIVQANNLPNPDRLSVGQELIIPNPS